MIRVEIPEEVEERFGEMVGQGATYQDLVTTALEGLEPEAKRELASDLLRSASRAEGYEG